MKKYMPQAGPWHRFKKRLTGGQYAQTFIDEVRERGISTLLDTMVLEITEDRVIYAANEKEGILEIEAGSIILAMGCRERTRSQVMIYGFRPAGVLTAGAVQRYINMEGYLPGKKAVILGSGIPVPARFWFFPPRPAIC